MVHQNTPPAALTDGPEVAARRDDECLRGRWQPATRPRTRQPPPRKQRHRHRRRPAPEPTARTHTVVSNDTSWALAEQFYGDGGKYPRIAQASGITNPDLIYLGQVLTIP